MLLSKERYKICFSLYYNAANTLLYPNNVQIYQFKAKDSKTKPYPLCMANISKDFTVNNMEKHGLREMLTIFFNSNTTADSDLENIH